MYCADCEKIESYFYNETCFWIFFPTLESVNKAIVFCGQNHYQAVQKDDKCLAIMIKHAQIKRFLFGLYGEFEPSELACTKITTTDGSELSISDMGKIVTADVLINRFNSTWISESIDKENYETHFQPIFKLEDNNIKPYAFEGLFRIRDEFNNIVPPAHVFKLAESSNLLYSIDLIARRSAVSHFSKAKLDGKLFINFDPSSVYDPSYCLRATASAINALGIKPEDVVFEITETHSVQDESVMRGILNFYRNAGFGVALDDIGSGWSGLNMLHKYRPDYVKIDMDLVRGLDTDPYKQTIVKHLVHIAKDNNIKVIAEGIETQGEFEILKSFGTDYYQGFLLQKPTLAEQTVKSERAKEIDNILRGIK